MKRRRTFDHEVASVGAARRFVAEVVAGNVPPMTADAVILIVSELATNSIRHARSGFSVEVDLTPAQLMIRMTDDGPGTPSVRPTAPQNPSGRGLRVVEAMSDEWGVQTRPRGKTVWFCMRLDPVTRTGRQLRRRSSTG